MVSKLQKQEVLDSTEALKINKDLLLTVFIEQLQDSRTLREAINESELIDPKNFKSELEFEMALASTASSIEILPPINVRGKRKGISRNHWVIKFKHNDVEKWNSTLSTLLALANKKNNARNTTSFRQ